MAVLEGEKTTSIALREDVTSGRLVSALPLYSLEFLDAAGIQNRVTFLRLREGVFTLHRADFLSYLHDYQDHRLSVQDAAAALVHSQSRATSGSRTDVSTDDENCVAVPHSTGGGRRRSSTRPSDGYCESGRHSRNDRRPSSSAQKRRTSKNMVQMMW